MCMEVIKQARIKRIIYTTKQEKHNNLPKPTQIKIEDVENYKQLLKDFFKNQRK